MQKGLISFVIPIYRNFEGVYDTLKSVFVQDYPNIEIILSDDGSPNYEDEIPRLRAFAESHRTPSIERIVYHHLPENQGTPMKRIILRRESTSRICLRRISLSVLMR